MTLIILRYGYVRGLSYQRSYLIIGGYLRLLALTVVRKTPRLLMTYVTLVFMLLGGAYTVMLNLRIILLIGPMPSTPLLLSMSSLYLKLRDLTLMSLCLIVLVLIMIGGVMSPELLDGYLKVLISNGASGFTFKVEGCEWAVTLLPKVDMTINPPSSDTSSPGGWRGPSHLDNPETLYGQLMRSPSE